MTVNNQCKWTLDVEWFINVGFTTESGQRGERHDFDTLEQLQEFEFLYRLQHRCLDGYREWKEGDDEYDVRELTLISPMQNFRNALRTKHVESKMERILIREKNIDK